MSCRRGPVRCGTLGGVSNTPESSLGVEVQREPTLPMSPRMSLWRAGSLGTELSRTPCSSPPMSRSRRVLLALPGDWGSALKYKVELDSVGQKYGSGLSPNTDLPSGELRLKSDIGDSSGLSISRLSSSSGCSIDVGSLMVWNSSLQSERGARPFSCDPDLEMPPQLPPAVSVLPPWPLKSCVYSSISSMAATPPAPYALLIFPRSPVFIASRMRSQWWWKQGQELLGWPPQVPGCSRREPATPEKEKLPWFWMEAAGRLLSPSEKDDSPPSIHVLPMWFRSVPWQISVDFGWRKR